MRMLAMMLALVALPAAAQEARPKLGIDATPITQENEYLRLNEAPDYWAFAPFLRPQLTPSADSIAAVTAVLNGVAGLPDTSDAPIPSQEAMLDLVGRDDWRQVTAEGGAGVTFSQLEEFAKAAVDAAGPEGYDVAGWKPGSEDLNSISILREWLMANETSADDALLVYFNQGVLTGDGEGPHVALVGGYDPAAGRVLILEVDQEWHIPYWSSDVKLLEAMLKPAPADQGVPEGETGGFVRIGPSEAGDAVQ
jgi:hypothetical protein